LVMLRLRRRIALWVAVAVGLPVVARVFHAAADAVELHRGPSPASHRLHLAGRGAEHLGYHLSSSRRRRNLQAKNTGASRLR
jgi:hypothetical protein